MAQTRRLGPEVFNGMTFEQAQALAEQGVDPPSADAMSRQRKTDEVLELSSEDLLDLVKVVCFVDTNPWTHERPLEQGEQADVPRKVAKVMEARRQVAIVSGD